ncbi:HAEPLYID family protein [Rhodoflexus sp.]
MRQFLLFLLLVLPYLAQAQSGDSVKILNTIADSLYIEEVENVKGLPAKVLHAEPLYIDLIRDLGARKGEAEWNVAYGMTDVTSFTRYEGLIEYEFAPINRLGLEIEVPFSIYKNNPTDNSIEIPSDRIEALKLAAQWSFWVSDRHDATAAIGYIHEFELADLNAINRRNFYKGNLYNPFFIIAKRWTNNLHSLIYTGPRILQEFGKKAQTKYDINTNFHYMISGTRNFVGMEVNKTFTNQGLKVIMRPQIRLGITDNFLIGLVTGIPMHNGQERFSSFVRIIYEPHHHK